MHIKFLILILIYAALERSGFPTNMRTDYAVQSSDVPITLLCPHEPGRLQGCYFGRWSKESRPIVEVARPGPNTCEPAGRISTMNSKYHLDRETFSLTINSIEARTDSGNYSCELMVLDPASPVGTTHVVSRALAIIILSLTVDGKS